MALGQDARSRKDNGRAREYPSGQVIPGTVYKVKRILGAGGMGVVYEVEDTTVGKRYVLKTLHSELNDRRDLARRMQQEARTLARLQHPNIVEVVTAGATTDELKLPFYVMERLDGQNLRVVIDKMGKVDPGHAYHITVDLLDALDHAHDAGVIHRDVKPDNVFLHRNAAGATVTKLLDFGIMRVLDGSHGDTAGRFLGTLRYAAPEQLRGDTLSARTDLYAAALVLYELIAGRGPFDDRGDAQAVGRAHLKDEAPLISNFAPQVPSPVVHLIRRALSKDPEGRPRDAFTFAAELRGFLKGKDAVSAEAARSALATAATAATAVNVLGQIGTVKTERPLHAATEVAVSPQEASASSRLPSAAPGSQPVQMATQATSASMPPMTIESGEVQQVDSRPPHEGIDRRAATRTSAGEALRPSAPPRASSGTESLTPPDDLDAYAATEASDPIAHSVQPYHPSLPPLESMPPAPPPLASLPPFHSVPPLRFAGQSTTAGRDGAANKWTPLLVAVGSASAVAAIAVGFYSLGKQQTAPQPPGSPANAAMTIAPAPAAPSAAPRSTPTAAATTAIASSTAAATAAPTAPAIAPGLPASSATPTISTAGASIAAPRRPLPSPAPRPADPNAPPRVPSGL